MTRISSQLGQIFRHARHSSGVTQEELSDRSGISVRTIAELELGRTCQPRASTIRRLAMALDMDDATMRKLFIMARQNPVSQ